MKRYFFSILFLSVLILPVTVLAAGVGDSTGNTGGSSGNTGTSYSVPANSICNGGACAVKNPLAANSFCGLVKNLLQAAIAIGIPIAVLFIVYAGFKFVLARGNPEKLAEARQNFLWTIIGIAIFLGAWLLASVVANTINQLGGGQNIISCN
ncbi:MAG: hypothetical protein Q7R71_01295 [bacterium]|nr:hypothetical protein [bacterium]